MLTPKFDFRKGNIQWKCQIVFGLVCVLVIGMFVRNAEPGFLELVRAHSQDSYYNLLVQGFRAGQLNVKRDPPPELARLADPYNPVVNNLYKWNSSHLSVDLSYYKGKLYLYFGVTPALVLFWPYVVLTGHYLSHKNAVVIFYAFGFLLAAGLLLAIWRRYFAEVSIWVLALGILAMGFTTGILEILSRCDVWEVAMSCGYAFAMLALVAIWGALHESKRQLLWLSSASLAYGLAIGSRPSLLFGAIILLVPVAQAWRAATEPVKLRRVGLLLAAAVGPVIIIGLGLMLYNILRFDNPFEFGWHYMLPEGYQATTAQQFSLHYLWFNFRFYFLEPMRWSGRYPYLQTASLPPLPSGYFGVGESFCGILGGYPLVWLALASPLAWRGRPAEEVSRLRWFVMASFLLFVMSALTVCLFFSASSRYEMDFLPALMLLAVIGVLGVERALAHSPIWRLLARMGWCLLLAYSLVFNLLASVEAHATANFFVGNSLLNSGRVDEAVKHFQMALLLQPESASIHISLGNALFLQRRMREAITQYQEALTLQPDSAEAYNCMGNALFQSGDVNDAIAQFQKAVEINPNFADAHINLGYSLLQTGHDDEAIFQYQQALALQPESVKAHDDLGYSLLRAGRVDEAIDQFQKSLEIQTDDDAAYYNLGYAYHQKRMAVKAIACFQKAIEIQPQSIRPKVTLAWMLATWPEPSARDGGKAIALARQSQALSTGNDPVILRVLAAAYAEAGRFPEAVSTAREALALASTQSAAGLTNALQHEIELYQSNSPCRSTGE